MIFLITPTGNRPKQFELCMRWMKQQTYKGKVVWIVVDDCIPKTTDILTAGFRENWFIIKKYPSPIWKPGDNTQGRNLREGIKIVKAFPKKHSDIVFIVEDDDYYKPEYLQEMIERFDGYDVVGEKFTIYYNIPQGRYKVYGNDKHSSLFQTGFTTKTISVFEECLNEKWIDIVFFKKVTAHYKVNLFEDGKLAVGIKGLPGRAGIGVGHSMRSGTYDTAMSELKKYLGEDFIYYL